jgi:hypothetical protein
VDGVAGALAGPAGRPSRRRAEALWSKLERVREWEVGMVSNQIKDGRHAQKWRQAREPGG